MTSAAHARACHHLPSSLIAVPSRLRSHLARQAILASLFGEDLPGLLEVFSALDKDKSGAVTWDEFVERIEAAFRPRAPAAHRKQLEKSAPPPFEAPPSAPPPPSVPA